MKQIVIAPTMDEAHYIAKIFEVPKGDCYSARNPAAVRGLRDVLVLAVRLNKWPPDLRRAVYPILADGVSTLVHVSVSTLVHVIEDRDAGKY